MPHPYVPRSRFWIFVAYVYLLRVQIVVALVVFGLPIVALWLPILGTDALFGNFFVLDRRGVFLSTFTAMLVTWSAVLTTRLVLLNGADRFGLKQAWTLNDLKPWAAGIASLIVVAPMIAGQYYGWRHLSTPASTAPTSWVLLSLAGGMLAAYFTVYAALLLAVLVAPVGTLEAARTFPSPPPLRWLLEVMHRESLPGVLDDLVGWVAARLRAVARHLPEDFCAGYIDRRPELGGRPNPGYELPWSGHFLALAFAAVAALVYFGIGYIRSSHVGEQSMVPALTYVLLLLMIVNWFASALTFLFDRFRVPLLLIVLLLGLVLGNYGPDHQFETVADAGTQDVTPSAVVLARASATPAPIVIVATAGGGIQAAAWTARVLTGLQGDVQIAPRIAMVSAVSGGAVGAMFFLDGYGRSPSGSGFDPHADLLGIVNSAEDDALDDVAFSLVYNDTPRALFGLKAGDDLLDRGRALEQHWAVQGNVQGNLSDWREGVADGWRPAVIFNSTVSETGEPMLFSTTDLPEQVTPVQNGHALLPVRKDFRRVYRGLDVPVTTAVRLASSFPYVSPAARANQGPRLEHLVDGGYYDNYGVASAIDWIDNAYRNYPQGRPFPRVLFILIKSFPNSELQNGRSHAWFFQSYAPLLALFNVRTTTQLVRDRLELLALRERLGTGADGRPLLQFASFQFPENDAPLSWKMNQKQIDAIDAQWMKIVNEADANGKEGDDLAQVRCVLAGRSAPRSARCAQVVGKDPW
ncbi:MAG TPA: patatin-like phospholipase family protein [Vicinamibacterales bacterium]|nr:patatin-like phospholipase family protein [Vicinamibacterales bacterium]